MKDFFGSLFVLFDIMLSMTEIVYKDTDFVLVNPDTINIDIDPKSSVKSKYYEPNKPYWLYALRLEHKKYYVGFTGKHNPYDRIMEHVEGQGAKWTQLHKPLEVMEIRYAGETTLSEINAFEINLTWAYILKYGVNRVRGGRLNSTERMLRVGKESVLMPYAVNELLLFTLLVVACAYIPLRHYFNWW